MPDHGGIYSISKRHRTATLNVEDNAVGSPQLVTLNGTGQDFGLSVSAANITVSPSQTATYTLTITPFGGFNHDVNLSCSGVPINSICNLPSHTTLDGVSPASVTLALTTTSAIANGTYTFTVSGTDTST